MLQSVSHVFLFMTERQLGAQSNSEMKQSTTTHTVVTEAKLSRQAGEGGGDIANLG